MKKKIFSILVVFLILFSLVIVILLLTNRNSNDNIFMNSYWDKRKDEYNTTKIIKEYVDPIPNDAIEFKKRTARFCLIIKNKRKNCRRYYYSVTDKNLIVNVGFKKVIYDYKFDENNQLVLLLSGDGYTHNYYYDKIY